VIDGAHPLLDEHIVSASDPGTHYWQGRLDSARAPWLLEHRVKGAPVLPASAMVEMALHGGFTIFGEHACVVDALRLENALVIREDRPAVVQLVISATLPGVASFRLASQDAGSGAAAPWVVHATGSLRVRAVTAGHRRADVGEGHDPERGERHYEATRRRGLGYGSAFQGVTTMTRRGAEIVTRVRATDAVRDDGDAYRIHPALLDACLQGSLAGLTGGAERERVTYVPTGLERLTLHARVSGTDALRCRISPGPGRHKADELVCDIDVVDKTWRLVLKVSGVWLAPLADQGGREADRCVFDLEWVRVSSLSAPGQTAAAGTWVVLGDGQVARDLSGRLMARGARCATSYPVGPRGSGEETIRGVVDLRGLDVNEGVLTTERLAAASAVRHLVDLVKILATSESPAGPRLVVVTAGVPSSPVMPGRSVSSRPGLGRRRGHRLRAP
jgi:acyl transferase domain-containing protein